MISEVKPMSKRTILWFVIFCLLGMPLYVYIISWFLFYFPPSYSTLPFISVAGSVFAALVLASSLAVITNQRSFILGFSFGVIVILQVLVIATQHDFLSKLWWFNIGEYLAFIFTCGIITRYFGKVSRVQNT